MLPYFYETLQHTTRQLHPFIPFLRTRKITALYCLSLRRYGKYITYPLVDNAAYVNWHKFKCIIQSDYQNDMVAQGKILNAIFTVREATADSTVVDYLNWVSWMWQLYEKNLKRSEFEDDGFIRFVQSGLVHDTELTETWIFK
jgi:hypothetical protein